MAERVSEALQSGARRGRPAAGWLLFRSLFSHRWWWKTLLVLAGIAVCIRLAVWQMDRLEQRKARNAETRLLLASAPIDLNVEALPADPSTLKYRRATALGRYDFSRQVALEPQNCNGVSGLHLLAPLVLGDRHLAVLVDRGWIPFAKMASETWSEFDEPGDVTVVGSLQTAQELPQGAVTGPQTSWYRVDLEAIQAQMPYELLPLYLVQAPAAEDNQALPYRQELDVDLSNGPHLNYVIQWLSFALILGGGYVWFVSNTTKDSEADR
jgi:cytochrome oxidase assembly protein ShyY1